MTDTPPTAPKHRLAAGLQTKALAGLVAVMLAAAIVALVFVTNGGGASSGKQADGQRDVGRTSSAAPATSSAASTPAAPSTSSAPSTHTAPSSSAPATSKSAGASSKSASVKPASSKSASSKSASSTHSPDSKEVFYTVKKGDTLTSIGHWFKDHGYLTLYQWNKSVIGQDPNLIFPGQKIIVVAGNVGVARGSR